jgi:hypothetical protein
MPITFTGIDLATTCRAEASREGGIPRGWAHPGIRTQWKLDHVDLPGLHGINNRELLDWSLKKDGCLAAARRYFPHPTPGAKKR